MKSRFHLFIAAGLFLLLFKPFAMHAQNAVPSASASSALIIREIDVQYAGPSTLSKSRILANMRTQVGKPYSDQAVEEDIRNLYATGNIANVRIFGEPVQDGVKVTVVVQTKSSIGEVLIEGVTQMKVASLRKKMTIKPGQPLNESNLEQDRQKILDEYEKKNITGTKVEYNVDSNEKTGKSKITFTVTEGTKTVIGAIRFEGNTLFKTKELRKVMKTKPANILSFFTKDGQLKNDQLDEDAAAIREFYQNHGYIDAEVRGPDIEQIRGSKVKVVFTIIEGEQYHTGKVAVSGAQVFTTDEVTKLLKLTEGGVYSPKTVRDDAKAIQDLYGSRGYIDLAVNAETVNGGKRIINVSYKIEEGTQTYIEHINIQGNTRTKDKVIRRELAVAPGEVYNTVRVDSSKQRLQNLNYFSRIDTYPSDTLVPGRKDLNVLVEEKRTGSFNFGAGFSSIDSILGFIEVQQTNFDIMHPWNFTGGGQRFRTRIQYGAKRKDFVIGLTEPWFLDYQLAVGGELFYNDASYISSIFNQRSYGFDINFRKPITNFTAVRVEYRLEDISIYGISGTAGTSGTASTSGTTHISDIIRGQAGDYLKSSINATITNDTRDSVFLTRSGHRVELTTSVAGGPLGGRVADYGFDLTASQYFKLPWDTIFLVNGEVATESSWSNGTTASGTNGLQPPIFDRLFLGGANSLRGFSYREVGPKDCHGEPIGGNTLARLTFEYTVPIVDRVRGAIFYDAGYVNYGSYDFLPQKYTAPLDKSGSGKKLASGGINSDFGIGFRLDLPIGPVRIDYGIPLQSDSWNKSTGRFNFNIGYQF